MGGVEDIVLTWGYRLLRALPYDYAVISTISQNFVRLQAGYWLRCRADQDLASQRAQYPLIKEYGLNYIGLNIMI